MNVLLLPSNNKQANKQAHAPYMHAVTLMQLFIAGHPTTSLALSQLHSYIKRTKKKKEQPVYAADRSTGCVTGATLK
jgi:hypothetical protein